MRCFPSAAILILMAVSYTHLDVYKRQLQGGKGSDNAVYGSVYGTALGKNG